MDIENINKPKSRKLPDDFDARAILNITDPNTEITGSLLSIAVDRYFNDKENAKKDKLEAKRREEEQRLMAEREKQDAERRKQMDEHYKNLPESQLKMLLTGTHYSCSVHRLPKRSEDYCRISK